jgi:CHAT domain-containing protein/Tfp pilus assembly protein PilF
LWEEARILPEAEGAEKLEAAAAAAQQAGDARAATWLWMSAGWHWDPAQAFERAAAVYARAAEQSQAAGDAWGAGDARTNQGVAAARQGDLAGARAALQQALAIRERLAPNSSVLVGILNNLSLVAGQQGDLAGVQAYLQGALAIQEQQAPDSPEVASRLYQLGDAAQEQGDLARARGYFQRALAIHQKQRNPDDQRAGAACLNVLGNVAWQQGDLTGAQAYYQRALAVQKQLDPDSVEVAYSLHNLGEVAHEQGDLDAAQAYYQQALTLLEQWVPESQELATGLNTLGALALQRGEPAEAQGYFQRALELLARLAPNSLAMADTFTNLGELALEQGRREEAARCYREGLRLAQARAGRAETVRTSWGLGRTLAAQGDLEGAAAAYQLCLDTLDEWRTRASSEAEERASLWVRYSSPFPEYAALLLNREQPDAAFHVSERAKGRALLEVLATGRTPLLERRLTDEERQEYAQRERSLGQLNRQVLQARQENDEARLKELLPHRDEARFQLANYEQRLYTLHPGLQAQVSEGQPLTADEARALSLPLDTLVLSYLVGEKQALLFALRRPAAAEAEGLAVQVLDVPVKDLTDAAADLRETLVPDDLTPNALEKYQGRWQRHYTERAQALGQTLLGPIQKWLKEVKHLIVCPDQFLYDLPFGALIAPSQKEPLLTTHAVSLAPSVTVLREWLKTAPKSTGLPRLLALGNPVLPSPPSPQKPAEVTEVKIASARQMTDPGGGWRGEFRRTREGDLMPLPGAEKEVQELARLYGDERAVVRVGEAAQEAWVKAEAGKYRILHFATHALLDNAAPMYSKLVLAQEGDLAGEDGLLEAREILQQWWDADLVVLSACQTARGKKAGGEGILGMSWACLVAGARQVVATQWSVRDDSTKALMVKFHQELLAGTPSAEALRRAQVYVREQPQWATPYHWAGFVLVGLGR